MQTLKTQLDYSISKPGRPSELGVIKELAYICGCVLNSSAIKAYLIFEVRLRRSDYVRLRVSLCCRKK